MDRDAERQRRAGRSLALLLCASAAGCASNSPPADRSGGRCSEAQVAGQLGIDPAEEYFALALNPGGTVQVDIGRYPLGIDVPPRVSRWSLRRFPLRVSLEAGEPPPGISREQFEQAAREAFAAWSGAIDGQVPAFVLQSSSGGELPLRWVDSAETPGEVGRMEASLGPGYSQFRPDAIKVPRVRSDGAQWTPESLRMVLLHEIGHALGILGHSGDASDLMYATERPGIRGPSKRDLNTLRMIYACPRDAFADP